MSRLLLPALLLALAACSPAQIVVDQAYETCFSGEECQAGSGTACIETTLQVFNNAFFCSSGCNFDSDCPDDLTNFARACLNGACYIQCVGSSQTCPDGNACVTFQQTDGALVQVCTP
jgi:hypothetical protein